MTLPDLVAPAPWRAEFARRIGWGLFHTAYAVQVSGREHVPVSGPCLVVSNHAGFADGPLVLSLAPRGITFLVKREMFASPVGPFLRLFGQIPVDRSRGDRTALGTALRVLEAGGAVGIFPEGTRGLGDVASIQQGAAWLALQSGAPVVPTACLGTRRPEQDKGSVPRPRHRLVVDFGEPLQLTPPAGIPGRERLAVATRQVQQALSAHVAAAAVRHRVRLGRELA